MGDKFWFACGTFGIFIVMWLLSLQIRRKIKSKFRGHLPPGPIQIPLIGNLLHMLPAVIKSPPQIFAQFWNYQPAYIILDSISKKYGPLTSLKIGMNPTVIVSSSEYAKIVYCREEFSARFADGWFVERSFGKALGLIFNNGEPYKEIKKFTNRMLKDFGFGKRKTMEEVITDELIEFVFDFGRKVKSIQGNVLYMRHIFNLPVLNVLWNMIGGMRFSYNDKQLHRIISIVEDLSKTFDVGGNILMAFPALRHYAPELTGHAYHMRLYSELHQFFRNILHERIQSGTCSGTPCDFVDTFIQAMGAQGETTDKSLFTEEQFIMVCLDLFTAGSETTSNTLDFAILLMLLNPKVQQRVQEEIDSVIGPNRLPNMQDRLRMPFTEATLLEVQRLCNVIPIVHRVCTTDTLLGPYLVEKGTVMLINIHSIHTNPEVWANANEFRPERFLDENGRLDAHPALLSFGMGKRVCMGENLAKTTLFMYFSAIMQRFTFEASPNHRLPVLQHGKGFTLSPDPYHALVKFRNE